MRRKQRQICPKLFNYFPFLKRKAKTNFENERENIWNKNGKTVLPMYIILSKVYMSIKMVPEVDSILDLEDFRNSSAKIFLEQNWKRILGDIREEIKQKGPCVCVLQGIALHYYVCLNTSEVSKKDTSKEKKWGQVQCLKPLILATCEVEIKKIAVWGQSWQKLHEIPCQSMARSSGMHLSPQLLEKHK
jgi:hypothetical protein